MNMLLHNMLLLFCVGFQNNGKHKQPSGKLSLKKVRSQWSKHCPRDDSSI